MTEVSQGFSRNVDIAATGLARNTTHVEAIPAANCREWINIDSIICQKSIFWFGVTGFGPVEYVVSCTPQSAIKQVEMSATGKN